MSQLPKSFYLLPLMLFSLTAHAQWDLSKMVSTHNGIATFTNNPN